MKRALWFSSVLASGLIAWTAQAQQNDPNQQQNNQNNNQQAQPQNNQNTNPQSQPQNNRNNDPQNLPRNNNPNNDPQNLPRNNNQQNLPANTNNNQQAQPQNTQNVNPAAANPNLPNTNVQAQPNTGVNVQAQPGAANTGVAVGAQANTAQAQGQGTMVQGRILRTAQDQFVVQGADNKQYTFYTNPQTSYWSNNNPIQYSNLQVGSNVSAWYVPQGERYFVNRVNVVPAGGAVVAPEAVNPAPAPAPAAPQADANVYQGEVVRLVGQDQVVIRTSDGREIIVYVSPQTTYRLNETPATFTQIQPGVPVRVDYELRNGRPYARGILGRRNR